MSTETALDIEQVHRLSTDEYHRLIEAGGFDEDTRVELIDGLLADMGPKTREHENAVTWLARQLMVAVDPERFEVRVGSPLTLEGSEPEPDISVIPHDAPRPYHPSTAALVIEVSVSSLRRDLARKPSVYAAAGVDEYWVIDLDGRRVVVHRDPGDDGYADVGEIHGTGGLAPAAIGVRAMALGDLLHAASA